MRGPSVFNSCPIQEPAWQQEEWNSPGISMENVKPFPRTHHLCLHLAQITSDSGFSEHSMGFLPSIQKVLKSTVRPGKFPERWSQTLSPKPVVSPSLVPCNEVTFQHDGLRGTTAQPGQGQGRAIFKPTPELFSLQHFEDWVEKQRWDLEETWDPGSPKQERSLQGGCCQGRMPQSSPKEGWRVLHAGVGRLAFSCTRCAFTDTPLPSSCFHYQQGKCNWEKAKMAQGSHGQTLHVPKFWKQSRVTLCWEGANWSICQFSSVNSHHTGN